MINATRDAIRYALRQVFPIESVPHIHLQQMPVDFVRPAFYMQLMPWHPQQIASSLRSYPTAWQLVYFPLEDDAGNADISDLHSKAMTLEELFGCPTSLTSPDETVFHLEGFTSEIRDSLLYCSIRLQAVRMKEEPTTAPMGDSDIALLPK